MTIEHSPTQDDEEPRILPGEADDAFRQRLKAWHGRKELELRESPVSLEDDERNRRMLEKFSRGDFSDITDDEKAA